ASAFGVLVCWGGPSRDLLEAGDLDVVLAALFAILALGFLVKFHRQPGVKAWLGLALTSVLGWYAQPSIFGGLCPLLLVYYFTAGPRHGLFWHLALLIGLSAPVAATLVWLLDWVAYWSIRSPIQLEVPIV